ncbi:hypothetical protein BKA62DRAFT_764682 [Auriculariales sp. MPI-PUGE-AT-0066]|nr:hypothetical protein BKA62DRAFT_764682 [Auriculariales sp. MPI-PUGE-AT-0066]
MSTSSTPRTPRTPLRRLSHGSLAGLSRSTTQHDAPSGMGFLDLIMNDLADESEGLLSNVERLNELSQSLAMFNESFASFLYMVKMDACCVEWPQAPTDESFALSRRHATQVAKRLKEGQEAEQAAAIAATAANATLSADVTAMPSLANETMITSGVNTPGKDHSADGRLRSALKKRAGAPPKPTAKEKRARDLAIEAAVNQMPLEFRSADVDLRRIVDKLVDKLMNSTGEGLPMSAFIKQPELTQAKVNKCLIAFVGCKLVEKTAGPTKMALYQWKGPMPRP